MRNRAYTILLTLLWALSIKAQTTAAEQLNMAIDYFQGGKYHEAMLIFEQLDRDYMLQTRHRAYMGVCYFYDWAFDKATATLDSIINDIEIFPPHEQSVYYYTDAESHFQMGHYQDAVPLYERMVNVCFPNERGDAFYRMGFCYMKQGDEANALEFFTSALAYYLAFPNDQRKQQTEQLRHMIAGLAQNLQADMQENKVNNVQPEPK